MSGRERKGNKISVSLELSCSQGQASWFIPPNAKLLRSQEDTKRLSKYCVPGQSRARGCLATKREIRVALGPSPSLLASPSRCSPTALLAVKLFLISPQQE